MNLRHVAALALVDWYLTTPPISLKGADGSAPLSSWHIEAAYDNAGECDSAQVRSQKVAKKSDLPDTVKRPLIQAMDLSQCVASDDPRLKAN